MQMFRAINKDILKKQGGKGGSGTALMTSLEFEGFVEFLL
jgi:hypothetical protein